MEKTDTDPAEMLVNAKQMARIIGRDQSYVRKLTGTVFTEVRRPGTTRLFYRLGDIAAYVTHLKEVLGGSPVDKELANEKLLKMRAEREYRENELAQQEGALHPSKLIFKLYADRIRACRDTALALPNKIAQIVSDETSVSANFKLLTQEMEELLLKLAAPRTEEVMANVGKYIPHENEVATEP
jgi:hypothetical protein